MEWAFLPKIWIKITGLEAVQKPEEMVAGGSMDVVLPILMARILEQTKRAMMASYGTFILRIIGVLSQVV